jgi:hypothetical protein
LSNHTAGNLFFTMTLTPEQTASVASWVAAGDSLSLIQKKLHDQFAISMTYMDVRFLVDDLNLQLKDAAPKADASDVTKSSARPPAEKAPEKKGFLDKVKEKVGLGGEAADDEMTDDDLADELPAGGPGSVSVTVDSVTLIPGAVASGEVTFSDGVTGKWIIDQYGRPGFTEVSQPGYRPTPEDGQAFMQELSAALQKRGF